MTYEIRVAMPDGQGAIHLIRADCIGCDDDGIDYSFWRDGTLVAIFPVERVISIVLKDEVSRVYPEADSSGRLPGEPDYGDPRPVR